MKITVAGKITDAAFHKCVTAVRYLQSQHPEVVSSECLQFFETQWEEFMKKTANRLKGVFYQHSGSHLIYLNDVAPGAQANSSDAMSLGCIHITASPVDSATSIVCAGPSSISSKVIVTSR